MTEGATDTSMSDTESPNPQPDALEETPAGDITTATEDTEIVETGADSPAAEAAPEEAPEEAPDGDGEAAPAKEAVKAPIRDYLAADLLDSITTITPEQLHSMEVSEVQQRESSLEEMISASVGEIREDRVIKGRVIGSNDREVLVDIGFKSEGIVPREEFGKEGLPEIGDEITVYLVRMEDLHGQTVLSKEKADFMARWSELRHKEENEETVTGTISRRIKGGMIVDLDGVPAFLPGSQVDVRPVQDFDAYIGREFEFKIVKLNESRKNIVLSRKELLEADMKEKRAALIAGLEVGQLLEGRVKNITDFGAFVDLGGLDGLLHITDLSWGRVHHPSEVVSLDEEITVKVINFDPEKQRVSLGLKQLQPHPWENVGAKYPAGSVVTGKVVSMTNYGAFVELERGVEGLVHVSEMSWTKHIRHPSEVFTLGESIETKILTLDTEERKISLGVKQLLPDPWDRIEEKYTVGSLRKGVVRNLTQFGAFVELEEGIDGLIHVTDLSWTLNVRHPKEILDKGDEVEVRILDVSRENRRIALGYKQVNDDPWEQIELHFTSGKRVRGEVFRMLEKGVILQMEMEIEGIIPARDISKSDREALLGEMAVGDILEVTVQELSADEKKVILMTDAVKVGEAEKKAEEPAAGPAPGKAEAEAPAAAEAEAAAPATGEAEAETPAETAEAPEPEPEVAAETDATGTEAPETDIAEAEPVADSEAAVIEEAPAPAEETAEAAEDEPEAAPAEAEAPAEKKAAAEKTPPVEEAAEPSAVAEDAEKPKTAAAKKKSAPKAKKKTVKKAAAAKKKPAAGSKAKAAQPAKKKAAAAKKS